ncbi:MAG: vitamin K epoxide reductase family protein [Proteobacteria bacterium]|nr:vitamin K epoxide reductase family protein [Pseudomonadota bacterium]MCP4916098.1 vitamin K epoxide reductase family protein [Pseudomonadota bacterium]
MQKLSSGLITLAVVAGIASLVLYDDTATRLVALLAGVGAMWLLAGGALARDPLLGTATAGGLGVVVSGYLTQQHNDPGSAVCNAGEVFNCEVVNTSQFSEIAGVPIALLGLAFYGAITVVSIMGWLARDSFAKAPVLVGFSGILGSLVAIVLMYLSGAELGAWCLFCIATYGFSFLIAGGGILASKEIGFAPNIVGALTGAADKSVLAAALSYLAVFGIGFVTCSPTGPIEPAELNSDSLLPLFSKVTGEIVIRGNEPVYGDPDAPYTLVEWADYECPYCGQVSPQLKQLVELHPEVKVIFKNYPLSAECNPHVPAAMHENACEAAVAGVCAGRQRAFWDLNRQMFQNQKYLAPADLAFMAGDLGLDKAAFQDCMADPSAAEYVQSDIADGKKALVNSTPSLYLKGLHPTEEWIHMEMAVEGANLLLLAHKDGIVLPPAPPPSED